MSLPLSLRLNFSWTLMGNGVYAAFRWGIVVLLAKLGSPEMVGQYALSFAIVEPIFSFGNLHLRAVLATDARRNYVFSEYIGLRLITTALMLVALIGITFVVGYRWETALIILLAGLGKAFESISDVFHGLLQQYEQMDRIAKSLMIKGFASLLLLGVGVYFTGTLIWGIVGLVLGWLLVLFGYDIQSGRLVLKSTPRAQEDFRVNQATAHSQLWPQWEIEKLIKLAWLALPLGIVMMLVGLSSSIPRLFIEQYYNERQLGFFAAMASLMMIGGMMVRALGQSASPRLAKYFAAGNRVDFSLLLLKLLGIGVLLGVLGIAVAWVAGKEILTFLFMPEYAKNVDVLVWMMGAAGISYVASFLGYGITAARYFRTQVPLFAVVTGITALACFMLIPTEGLRGAAIALFIGALVQVVCSVGLVLYALRRLPFQEAQIASYAS